MHSAASNLDSSYLDSVLKCTQVIQIVYQIVYSSYLDSVLACKTGCWTIWVHTAPKSMKPIGTYLSIFGDFSWDFSDFSNFQRFFLEKANLTQWRILRRLELDAGQEKINTQLKKNSAPYFELMNEKKNHLIIFFHSRPIPDLHLKQFRSQRLSKLSSNFYKCSFFNGIAN